MSALAGALQRGDAAAVAQNVRELVRLRPAPGPPSAAVEREAREAAQQIEDESAAAFVEQLGAAARFAGEGNLVKAHSHRLAALGDFFAYFLRQSGPTSEESWLSPTLRVLLNDVVEFASAADADAFSVRKSTLARHACLDGLSQHFLQKQQSNLIAHARRARAAARQSSLDGSGPPAISSCDWVTALLVNVQFKVCFRTGNMNPAKNVEGTAQAPLEAGLVPMADRALFQYYSGRMAIMKDEFRDALERLKDAAELSRGQSERNYNLVYARLLPLRILVDGVIPKAFGPGAPLWERYGGIVTSVRNGDIAGFDRHVQEHSDYFARIGVSRVVMRLRALVQRQVVRLIARELDTNIVKLPVVAHVLRAMSSGPNQPRDTDYVPSYDRIDETEAMLCELLSRNLMRGYFSHERASLVLSRSEPFPALSKARP